MPPAAHFGCAEGAVQFVKPHPPLRGPYLFCHGRKDMEEKTVRTRNSAVAPDSLTFGLFAWLVSLPQPIETAEQKREKPESLRMDSGQILFNFAGTNISRSRILDSRNSAARPKGVRTTACVTTKRKMERQAFSGAKALFRVQRLFSPHSFLARQKRMGLRSKARAIPAQKNLRGGGRNRAERAEFAHSSKINT